MSSLRKPLRARESGGLGLLVFGFGGMQIFEARAGLQQRKTLARGFGSLCCCIALVAGVVELLARDGVCGDQLFHALVGDFGVGCVGSGGGVVGLGLIDLLAARAVAGCFQRGLLRMRRGFGLGDLFGAIAAQHLVEVGLRLLKRCLGLRALRLQFIAFETDECRSCLDDLALFDRNLR